MVQIAPSILSADFLHLEKDVELVNRYADILHFDVMDGVFVPNISFGFPVIEAVARKAEKPMDVHLMIVNPEKYVDRFAKAGASMISFHLNASEDPEALLKHIRSLGVKAGLVINPDIPVGLEEIAMHAMEPNLDQRYANADEVLADLESFRKNPSVIFGYSITSGIASDGSLTQTSSKREVAALKTPSKRSAEMTREEYRESKKRSRKTGVLVGILCVAVFAILAFLFMWKVEVHLDFWEETVQERQQPSVS